MPVHQLEYTQLA